jgi:hypothetical protein
MEVRMIKYFLIMFVILTGCAKVLPHARITKFGTTNLIYPNFYLSLYDCNDKYVPLGIIKHETIPALISRLSIGGNANERQTMIYEYLDINSCFSNLVFRARQELGANGIIHLEIKRVDHTIKDGPDLVLGFGYQIFGMAIKVKP